MQVAGGFGFNVHVFMFLSFLILSRGIKLRPQNMAYYSFLQNIHMRQTFEADRTTVLAK